MKYKIAFNRMATGKLPQGDKRWAEFNDSFDNLTLTPVEIADQIYKGHSYTTWHSGRRKIENFICAQHIAIDMDSKDNRSCFATLERHDLVRMYGSIMHTTPTHSDDAPKARIIFLLDGLIEDAHAYQAAATFLVAQFDGADVACTDASRFFYGSRNCEIWLGGNVLPINQLRHFYRLSRGKANTSQAQPAQRTAQAATHADRVFAGDTTQTLLEPVLSAPEGNRNNTLNRQAFLAGKDIAVGRVSENEIVDALLVAARQSGLGEQEAIKTIYSGVRAGRAQGMH